MAENSYIGASFFMIIQYNSVVRPKLANRFGSNLFDLKSQKLSEKVRKWRSLTEVEEKMKQSAAVAVGQLAGGYFDSMLVGMTFRDLYKRSGHRSHIFRYGIRSNKGGKDNNRSESSHRLGDHTMMTPAISKMTTSSTFPICSFLWTTMGSQRKIKRLNNKEGGKR